MPMDLIPLCTVHARVRPPIDIGPGPAGFRRIVEVESVTVEGDRLRGSAQGGAAADWIVVGANGIATLDVRFTFQTHDGATIFVQYSGRVDTNPPREERVIHVAPLFETSDPRYTWLNAVQAVGAGSFAEDGVAYEWFEVR